jgi:hypothetical protein
MASTAQLGPAATGQIFCWSTQALLAIGDYRRAAEWIEAVDTGGVAGIPGDCAVHRAEVLRAVGRLRDAEAEAMAALSIIHAVDLRHARTAHRELAMIYLAGGEIKRAERAFRHAAAWGGRRTRTCPPTDRPGTVRQSGLDDRRGPRRRRP